MKVTKDNQVLVVGWQYDVPQAPTKTCCILRNDKKEELLRVCVVKHVNDPQDKDKARKYSLNKLLRMLYPGRENRDVRKMFWEAYLHRNDRVAYPPMQVVASAPPTSHLSEQS